MDEEIVNLSATDLDPDELDKAIQKHIKEVEKSNKKPKPSSSLQSKASKEETKEGEKISVVVKKQGVSTEVKSQTEIKVGGKGDSEDLDKPKVQTHRKGIIQPLNDLKNTEKTTADASKKVKPEPEEAEAKKIKIEPIEKSEQPVNKEADSNSPEAKNSSNNQEDKQPENTSSEKVTEAEDKLGTKTNASLLPKEQAQANTVGPPNEAKQAEQHDLKVFDTKKYHLPIKARSSHRIRSSTGLLIIFVFIALVAGYVSYQLGLLELGDLLP